MLVGINGWVIAKWAGLEYTHARASIEWAYLTLARYLTVHGVQTLYGDAEWFPYWYGGVPFENTYPPLLHYLVAVWSKLGQVTAGRAYHLVTAVLYVAGPVGVFLLCQRWTRALWPSVFAGVFYSVFAPCSWLMPSITGDLAGYWMNQRLSALARYGEGPHVSSLALLPFALWAVDWALDRYEWRRAAIAALACAAVPLTNSIGGLALAWGVLAIAVARGRAHWLPVAGIGLWAYLLALRWLNPTMLSDVQRNAQFVGGLFTMDARHSLMLAVLAVVSVAVVMKWRLPVLGFLLPMTVIPLSWEYLEFYFLPQPHRYHLEMDLALALVIGVGLAKLPRVWAGAGIVGMLCFGIVQGRALDPQILPMVLQETWEHRITSWMSNYDSGARVYYQGSPRFFAGVERDQTQFGGGFLNGLKLPSFFLTDYGITAMKRDGPLTVAWLKALGVDFVAVGEANSEEPFKPWQDPGSFRGLLEEVWRERGDVIYETKRRNESLAHVIPRGALMERLPVSFVDSAEMYRYVAALEGEASNGGVLTWLAPGKARVEVETRKGEVVSVQVAHDPRWRARVGGKAWPIHRDALGWMWIEPQQTGPAVIEMEFHHPRWMLVVWVTAWLIFFGALFGGFSARLPL